jgi:CelD/BcsL family acetyltransferase involved in cellulose biosynthesis
VSSAGTHAAPRSAIAGASRLEPVERLSELRGEWSALALASRNVFSSFEFLAGWWEHFGAGRPLRTAVLRDGDGRARLILPLYLWRGRPLRVLRFLGNGAGDLLGPVCAPELRGEAARAIERLLADPPWGWDVFVGEHLNAEAGYRECLSGLLLRREGYPLLRADGDFEHFLAARSSNFRRQARARRRRLEREHRVRFRLTADADRLDADLDTLFRLHAERWREQSSFGGPRTAFHRAFARAAFDRGWLRLRSLELDGRPVAATYGFRFAGVESVFQSGRDPRLEHESLGLVMLTEAVRDALDDGVREFRLLRGHSPYKYRFATEDEGLENIAVAAGRRGGAALAALRAVSGCAPARRLLEGPLDL